MLLKIGQIQGTAQQWAEPLAHPLLQSGTFAFDPKLNQSPHDNGQLARGWFSLYEHPGVHITIVLQKAGKCFGALPQSAGLVVRFAAAFEQLIECLL